MPHTFQRVYEIYMYIYIINRLTERIAELEEENKNLKESNRQLLLHKDKQGGSDSSGGDPLDTSSSPKGPVEVEDPLAPFVVPGDR